MAQKVLIVTSCDMDHESGEEVTDGVVTVEFGYDGKPYVVELCPDHFDEYHHWMQDYLDHGARPVSAPRRSRPSAASGAAPAGGKEDLAAIRTWARANGFHVNERGRIPGEIRDAYANR